MLSVQIKNRFRNLITIQSKAVDSNNVPLETITLEIPSDAPLSRQEIRKLYWPKRWTHLIVEHLVTGNGDFSCYEF